MRHALVPTIAAVVLAAASTLGLTRSSSTPTPTHVTAAFFDGVTHGDYRQTCRAWLAGRHHQAQCVAYLVLLTVSSGPGSYRVVPHSYRGWREGETRVASVDVVNAGEIITARLVKTRAHGWLVVAVR